MAWRKILATWSNADDTTTSEAVLNRFNNKEEAWLSESRDIRYSNNQIICLQSAGGQIDIVVNGELSDSKKIMKKYSLSSYGETT